MTTFHNETDKRTSLVAGDVLRVGEGAFMDAVILGFNDVGDMKVSRPYAYASNVGTTGPTPLLGAETYVFAAGGFKNLPHVGHSRRT
jgi:hypothetical protein